MISPFTWVSPGLHNELAHITLDEVCLHLNNYLNNFVLDDIAAIAYANRFLNDQAVNSNAQAMTLLYYCLVRAHEVAPLDDSIISLLNMLQPDDSLKEQLALLKRVAPDAEIKEKVQHHFASNQGKRGERLALQMLNELPACVWAAIALLRGDFDEGRAPGEWLTHFKCMPKLKQQWNTILFHHYALLGLYDNALEQWAMLDTPKLGSYSLNLAAEMFFATGDRAKASTLYMQSLKKDPRQGPVRYRLEALSSPFTPDTSLVENRLLNIYLYSWNKANFLENTLLGLAKTNIGNARIRVLLNGCTDDSFERVSRIKDEHFRDSLQIISLPINIGAPAARNWLIALPETAQADYTAFLDDDVDVQENWLATLLTVLEANPKAGVVGCKVINPGTPKRYQYLYRTPSIVKDNLIRISLDSPPIKNDTGLYDFIRPTVNVMGCCHVFRRQALLDCPTFDLRFSPSQMDDVAHDFELAIKGYEIFYCGHTTCVHHQNTGKNFINSQSIAQLGNILGNDVKFFHKFWEVRDKLRLLISS